MVFPIQQPTASNFEVWRHTIYLLSSPTLRLGIPLGWLRRLPYDRYLWRVSRDRSILVRVDTKDDSTRLFLPTSNASTRQGRRYSPSNRQLTSQPLLPFLASVLAHPDNSVSIHSVALDPNIPEADKPTSLLATIRSFPNQSLWQSLDLDGDGEWIIDGLARGSLAIVHNGSFMEHMDDTSCSAGGIIFCKYNRRIATFSAAERTNNYTASNYRGELLGGLLAALILKAASSILSGDAHPAVIACYNMGVVIHGNNRHQSLREAQAQADIILCFRETLASLPFPTVYEHVYGHQDKNIPWDSLTLLQQLNCIADQLAKEALWRSFSSGRFISSNFPFESFRIIINGSKVTSSIRDTLYKSWGYKAAKHLFDQRKIVSSQNFELICWDAVSEAMSIYPHMFRVFVTKMVSHFCGTNLQLFRYGETDAHSCPSCGQPEESSSHITRCMDPGRSQMFGESADLFLEWLQDTHMDSDLIKCIDAYLQSCGKVPMCEIAVSFSQYSKIAEDIDALGWECFLEGRIPQSLVDYQKPSLRQCDSFWKIHTWSSNCVQYLLNITHRQWLYRNARIYLKKLDGMTTAEHLEVIDLVKDMMLVDPADLLPCHRSLLQVDFQQLGQGSSIDRKLWLTKMHSAISAAQAPPTPLQADDDSESDPQPSAYTQLAFSNYERYRLRSGILATKHSNMAKRVRL